MPEPAMVAKATATGLVVHRSEDAGALVAGLAEVLAAPPADPFEPEVVAVPARGVERWITQQLSGRLGAGARGDGVCARVEFPRPGDLVAEAVAAVSPEHAEAVRAWRPDRAVWPLLEVVDGLLAGSGAGFDALRHHLAPTDGAPSGRRYPVARHLAGLFARYAGARPELLCAWAAGRDDEVPDDLRWQPQLWRELRDRLGPSPAELLEDACARLRERPGTAGLPRRLSVFGASRFDAAELAVLAALAAGREVHLWIHSASPALWDAVAATSGVAVRRAEAPPVGRNPLLASLTRDVRELQWRLAALHPVDDLHHSHPATATTTLLRHLQADLRADRPPTPAFEPAVADRSIQVHACHGRARQVEVLREVLVGLMADDPTLEPRDVLVMCPDIEQFAPLLTAAFGAEDHPGGRLRVSLADRSPRRTNPLLDVAARLLELASGRVTATQVLDLAGTEPVRLRFGLGDEDVEQLRGWAVAAGVRWGLSGEHRGRWQLARTEQGTWRAGVDRLLAGVPLDGGDVLLGGALPVEDVDSSAIELAGRFAEFVDRLEAALTAFAGRRPVAEWLELIERAVTELAAAPPDAPWQSAALRAELGEVRESAAGAAAEIGLTELAALVGHRLEGRPTTAGFRTGGLTICTLTPMRSVPHRVVCLLGMDDGAFPRQGAVDGDDLLLRDPRLGERDRRSEDRQLFLDAICAAGEHLVITYSGADVRTGAVLPPAVPVGELLDQLDASAGCASGGSVRDAVVVRHPLQPFDQRNFRAGELGRSGPFSFDRAWLDGAVAGAGERVPAPPFLDGGLPPDAEDVVELSRLESFWQNPSTGFLGQRLEITPASRDEDPDDALPVEPNALEMWQVADRVLDARLGGMAIDDVRAIERARGDLPPPPLGDRRLGEVGGTVDRLVRESAGFRAGPAETLDVDVQLPDGRRLLGAVRGVHDDVLLTVTYSRVKAKQRLRAWIRLLALTAARPDLRWRAVVVGRGEKGDDLLVVTLGPVSGDAARVGLAELVRLRDAGRCTPLPLPVGAGEAYAAARHRGRDAAQALRAAEGCWASGYRRTGEDDDPAHALVWGHRAPLDELTGWAAPAGTLDGVVGEPHDFGRLARAVWQPLLDAERKSER